MPAHIELGAHPGPWDSEQEIQLFREEPFEIEEVNPVSIARRLNLYLPIFSDEFHKSISESVWYSIDKGRYYLEIRNPDILEKLRSSAEVDIIDFDDCVFSATGWHKREYELISTSPALKARGIDISFEEARELYQLSKIKKIPGKVVSEPRYTPLLNLLLLTQYARRLEAGMQKDEAWAKTKQDCEDAVKTIAQTGEAYLSDFPIDHDIVDIFMSNSPASYTYDRIVQLLFHNRANARHLKIIATRGTPEGPLGQVYKIHSSGIINEGVDAVLYTNDLKADAILQLSRLFDLKDKFIRVYDDNPNEILPYRQLARSRGMDMLKLIHIRHPDAKRKEAIAVETEDDKPQSIPDKVSGIILDHYNPIPDWTIII